MAESLKQQCSDIRTISTLRAQLAEAQSKLIDKRDDLRASVRRRERLVRMVAERDALLHEVLEGKHTTPGWNQRMKAALSASAEPNQCDGCQAGIPLVNGAHRMGKPGGYADTMSCQAGKYASAEPIALAVHPVNMKTMMQAYGKVDHKTLLHGTSNWCAAMATALRCALHGEPSAPVERDDPCTWTDRQVLDFLGVALRNVDIEGVVRLSEIRQGFEYMRNRAILERKP